MESNIRKAHFNYKHVKTHSSMLYLSQSSFMHGPQSAQGTTHFLLHRGNGNAKLVRDDI